MDGEPIDNGMIVIRGDRIIAVGQPINVPDGATRIDLEGATVTPGLIDCWSALGLTGRGSGGDPTQRAFDAFNVYGMEEIESAWANGITTVQLPARGGAGVNGSAAIVRLKPDPRRPRAGEVVEEEVGICIDLASNASPIARLNVLDSIRRRFRSVEEYREARELYFEEALPEYREKLEERAKKESGNGNGEGEDEDEDGESNRRGNGNRPTQDDGDGNGNGGDNGNGNGDGEKKDEIEKPTEPPLNRAHEVLIRVLDQELPVLVEAHLASDILNAIDLAAEFNLDMTLVGGTEAWLVADELAKSDVRVILGPGVGSGDHASPQTQAVTTLLEVDVPFTISSGGSVGSASQHLLLIAQMIAAENPDAGLDPLALLTRDAAGFLGLEQQGVIRPGSLADVVVWSGDPREPGASVQRVMIDGRIAYERQTE